MDNCTVLESAKPGMDLFLFASITMAFHKMLFHRLDFTVLEISEIDIEFKKQM